jgi:hypothetical protein
MGDRGDRVASRHADVRNRDARDPVGPGDIELLSRLGKPILFGLQRVGE